MNIEWKHHRLKETLRSTVAELLDERSERICFYLEDGAQVGEKVAGQTRIPAGRYELVLRTDSAKFARYYIDPWTKDWFKGMPHYVDVAGDGAGFENVSFKYVMAHPGTTVKDTDGCPLTGGEYVRGASGDFEIKGGTSRPAFKKLCLAFYAHLDAGRHVFVTVTEDALERAA